MKRKNNIVLSVALVALAAALLLCWVGFYLRGQQAENAPPIADGVIDLTGFDLAEEVVRLPLDWDFWPGLHTPEELESGAAGAPRKFQPEDEKVLRSGTYRATLRLPEGGMYAINAWSLDYATRIYADGEEVLSVGTVAGSAGGFVPRIQSYVLPLFTEGETLELVVQYANFSHPEGGVMRDMAFSTFENIERYATDAMLPTYLFSGGLALMAAFYLLQFLLHRRKESAAFALCCLLLAFRSQQMVISLLPADYDWYALFRGFFIGSTMVYPCFLLLTHFLFPGRFRPWVLIATAAALGAVDLLVLLLPLTISGGFIMPAVLIAVPGTLYYLLRVVTLYPESDTAGRLSIAGLTIFILAHTTESLLLTSVPFITRTGLAPFGLAAAVLCYMLALNIRQRESAVLLERERRRAEELDQVNKMKTEFLENVTHELKTPLTVISGYAQDSLVVLGDTPPDLEDLKYNQRHIVSEAGRLDRMVNQLLDVAAIEGGRMAMEREPVSLASLLRSMADASFSRLDPHGNTLELKIADGLPDVLCDRDRIQQVLLNLLSNAVRHTKGGTITLSLRAGEGYQEIRVADTGEGMDAGSRAQAFKSYVERENRITGRSGMGLYICKKIIAAHGGEIGIESVPGWGTAVVFRLPEAGEEAET
ncbi:MAG: ATP-binding protein [Bacillota bacterium]|nr:ATP-binding protein [Bacillota bacterium]